MSKRRYRATALLLTVLPTWGELAAHSAPPPGDILGSYLQHRAWMEAGAIQVRDNDQMRVRFLADSRSPVSRLDLTFARYEGDAWYAARDHQDRDGSPMDQDGAVRAMAWDLGMTRASEPWEVAVTTAWPAVRPDAQRQAEKAGLDEDVFRKARLMMPAPIVAMTANYAVAAMLLREKLSHVRTEDERASRGLDDSVLRRFLAAGQASDLEPGDAAYLMSLLEGEQEHWAGGGSTSHGVRQLPVPLRLARAAAAYRDGSGTAHPCATQASDDATGSGETGTSAGACLVDRTDQDLYAWYRRVFEREMPSQPARGPHKHLVEALRAVHPLWVPPLRPWAISAGARVEIVEHLAVRDGPMDARSEQADAVLTRRARKVAMEVPKP